MQHRFHAVSVASRSEASTVLETEHHLYGIYLHSACEAWALQLRRTPLHPTLQRWTQESASLNSASTTILRYWTLCSTVRTYTHRIASRRRNDKTVEDKAPRHIYQLVYAAVQGP